MKKQLIILLLSGIVIPVLAQQTNELPQWRGNGSKQGKNNHPKKTEQRQKQKYQFMNKALSEIGVSKKDRIKISVLQNTHREKMKINSQRTAAAREKLSRLQAHGASDAEFDVAIQNITAAQAEQLKILVKNRSEMEKILGKEKYERFMDNARAQFQQHGRRGGSGMPLRPNHPSMPRNNSTKNKSPKLSEPLEDQAPISLPES